MKTAKMYDKTQQHMTTFTFDHCSSMKYWITIIIKRVIMHRTDIDNIISVDNWLEDEWKMRFTFNKNVEELF